MLCAHCGHDHIGADGEIDINFCGEQVMEDGQAVLCGCPDFDF